MKPYKRFDNNLIAIGMQGILVLVFVSGQTIQLFTKLQTKLGSVVAASVLGFTSIDQAVAVMIVCNLVVIVLFCALIGYQVSLS